MRGGGLQAGSGRGERAERRPGFLFSDFSQAVPFPSSNAFRSRANYLAALAVEALAPAWRAYGRMRTGPPSPASEWKRALILGDHHIGDLLYRSASLERLKEGLPQCEFHYLAAAGSSEILAGNPALTSILPWIRPDSPLDLRPERLKELRGMGFDAALCTNCIKYWPELWLALRLGIPNRVGYTYKGFSGLVTHAMPMDFPKPYPAYFRGLCGGADGREAGLAAPAHHSCGRGRRSRGRRALGRAGAAGSSRRRSPVS